LKLPPFPSSSYCIQIVDFICPNILYIKVKSSFVRNINSHLIFSGQRFNTVTIVIMFNTAICPLGTWLRPAFQPGSAGPVRTARAAFPGGARWRLRSSSFAPAPARTQSGTRQRSASAALSAGQGEPLPPPSGAVRAVARPSGRLSRRRATSVAARRICSLPWPMWARGQRIDKIFGTFETCS